MTLQSFLKALEAREPSLVKGSKHHTYIAPAEAVHYYNCAKCHFTKANRKKYGTHQGPCTCGADQLQKNVIYWLGELREIAKGASI